MIKSGVEQPLLLWWLQQVSFRSTSSCRRLEQRPQQEAERPIRKIFGPRAAASQQHTGVRTGTQQGCVWIFPRSPGPGESPCAYVKCLFCVFPFLSWQRPSILGQGVELWIFQRSTRVHFPKNACNLSRVFRGQRLGFFNTAGHIDDDKSIICLVFDPDHTLECRVEEKGITGELRLAWTHRIWGEECALGWEDKFAQGLVTLAIFLHHLQGLLPRPRAFWWRRGLSSSLKGCSRNF